MRGPFCSHRADALLWIETQYFGDVVVYEVEAYLQRNLTSSYTAAPPSRAVTPDAATRAR
ncbi:hypothetical protein PR002_g27638 [Phytophthora rubi]|uniref:Uncharacterized protein n=1 Tax=Phytophthora rubi TaxID=129364 RepID=A0A6A3HJ35_9STRA|nr:hypothetical protein PR002_g27638 [Phytophthora rubi]